MRTILTATAILVSLSGAAMACPTITEGRASYSVTGEDLYSPNTYSVVAGGNHDLQSCGFNHTGNVIAQPDFSFYTSGMGEYGRLEIEVTSQSCDTILLVNAADASWWYDDDSNGELRPAIDLYGQGVISGRIDVWVGTYGSTTCNANVELETWYN